jgi:hypothetical protein
MSGVHDWFPLLVIEGHCFILTTLFSCPRWSMSSPPAYHFSPALTETISCSSFYDSDDEEKLEAHDQTSDRFLALSSSSTAPDNFSSDSPSHQDYTSSDCATRLSSDLDDDDDPGQSTRPTSPGVPNDLQRNDLSSNTLAQDKFTERLDCLLFAVLQDRELDGKHTRTYGCRSLSSCSSDSTQTTLEDRENDCQGSSRDSVAASEVDAENINPAAHARGSNDCRRDSRASKSCPLFSYVRTSLGPFPAPSLSLPTHESVPPTSKNVSEYHRAIAPRFPLVPAYDSTHSLSGSLDDSGNHLDPTSESSASLSSENTSCSVSPRFSSGSFAHSGNFECIARRLSRTGCPDTTLNAHISTHRSTLADNALITETSNGTKRHHPLLDNRVASVRPRGQVLSLAELTPPSRKKQKLDHLVALRPTRSLSSAPSSSAYFAKGPASLRRAQSLRSDPSRLIAENNKVSLRMLFAMFLPIRQSHRHLLKENHIPVVRINSLIGAHAQRVHLGTPSLVVTVPNTPTSLSSRNPHTLRRQRLAMKQRSCVIGPVPIIAPPLPHLIPRPPLSEESRARLRLKRFLQREFCSRTEEGLSASDTLSVCEEALVVTNEDHDRRANGSDEPASYAQNSSETGPRTEREKRFCDASALRTREVIEWILTVRVLLAPLCFF